MAEAAPPLPSANSSAGHLYVRVEDAHAVDIPFLFERQGQRMGRAVIASFVSHAAVLLFAVLAIRYVPAAAVHDRDSCRFKPTATSFG